MRDFPSYKFVSACCALLSLQLFTALIADAQEPAAPTVDPAAAPPTVDPNSAAADPAPSADAAPEKETYATATVDSGAPAVEAPQPAMDTHGMVNLQAPVDLQWHALGVMELPGLGGLRVGATFYAPVVPVLVGVAASRSWGADAIHAAGERIGALGRNTTGTFTVEARVGIGFEFWGRDEQSGSTSTTEWTPMGNLVTSYTYAIHPPVYNRWSIYGGIRSRSNPGTKACPTNDRSLPEDCGETGQTFLVLGLETFAAQRAQFDTAEWGRLETRFAETWNFNVLYSSGNDYGRTGIASRLGGEITFTMVKLPYALTMGGGWDGENILLTLGMGAGGAHSFFRPVPDSSEIPN